MQKKAQGLEAHRVTTSGEPALGTKAFEPIKPVLLVKGFSPNKLRRVPASFLVIQQQPYQVNHNAAITPQ
jgi:hypothetical protein